MIKKMTMSEKGKRKRIKIKRKRMNFGKEDKKCCCLFDYYLHDDISLFFGIRVICSVLGHSKVTSFVSVLK
jgi:hypothetical protein|tara:strand:- start:63 stop:275 length:213 start_codon:yes stop_codon:yes gene_type:complete